MTEKKQASLFQALLPIISMAIMIVVGYGIFKVKIEAILILTAIITGLVARKLGYSWKEMQIGIVDRVTLATPAVLTLWSVGALIASWMFAGIVPMIITYGIQIIHPKFLIVTGFILTAIVSTVTGTSWGSAGTIGVALMGIATAFGIPLPIMAGAIVSGAFFGDKMSPLSDTTNLAAVAAGSDLYDHIKQMMTTTIPASLIAMVIYTFVGLKFSGQFTAPETVQVLLDQLDVMYNWNVLLLIPPILVIVGSLRKWPTVPTLIGVALLSLILGVGIQGFNLNDGLYAIISGFDISMTGFEGEATWEVKRLINRGGINSMTGTTVLIICSMGFAGIMSISKMLDVVLRHILKRVKSTKGLLLSTMGVGVLVGCISGNANVEIIVTGEMFQSEYIKRKIHPANLSRILEDVGTMFMVIIPWSANAVYIVGTLGVETIDYAPWAIVNYLGMVVGAIIALTGLGIRKMTEVECKELSDEYHLIS